MIDWCPQITELLRLCEEHARKNKFSHLAVMMIGRGADAAEATAIAGHAGENRMAGMVLSEIRSTLIPTLEKYIKDREKPKRDLSLKLDHVCYDLNYDPLCFDFLTWLISSEMSKRRYGITAPLRVGFWGIENNPEAKGWLNNVFRPCLKLIGAVEDPKAVHGHSSNNFVSAAICEASRRGEEVPILKASNPTPHNGVTITLRESTHHEDDRNSNLEAWLKFAQYLQDRGEKVVFVRDTEKAYEPLSFPTDALAATYLDRRMNLYQGAKINLFVSNGPCGLALYSDRPYLIFIKPDDRTNNAKFWKNRLGIEIGQQFPWAKKGQRIVWSGDSYEELVRGWGTT